MINWLHNFEPSALLLSVGPLNIHWYGLCLVFGMVAALAVSLYLAKLYGLARETVFDLSFWLIIGGLAGARLYDVLLELPYYIEHPWRVFAVWQGGLAIHGGIIAGILITIAFARRNKIDFFKLASLMVPGLALAQAIGRWGNYFNQELFGLPTNLAWGIPIDILNRPAAYATATHFHPTFLYESLGCLLIFLILLYFNRRAAKKNSFSKIFYVWSLCAYVILYSILRLALEFIKIDTTPLVLGMRWPQIASLLLIAGALSILSSSYARSKERL